MLELDKLNFEPLELDILDIEPTIVKYNNPLQVEKLNIERLHNLYVYLETGLNRLHENQLELVSRR